MENNPRPSFEDRQLQIAQLDLLININAHMGTLIAMLSNMAHPKSPHAAKSMAGRAEQMDLTKDFLPSKLPPFP